MPSHDEMARWRRDMRRHEEKYRQPARPSLEREWVRLRAAEMVANDPGLSFSDAEEAAAAEWDQGVALIRGERA